jgi:hypothetical protein
MPGTTIQRAPAGRLDRRRGLRLKFEGTVVRHEHDGVEAARCVPSMMAGLWCRKPPNLAAERVVGAAGETDPVDGGGLMPRW